MIRKYCKALLLVSFCLTLSACLGKGEEVQSKAVGENNSDVSNLNWTIEDFNFTDHNNSKFGLKDLKGKVWLTDFVFTRCPNVCPPMTANMNIVQKKLKEAGLNIDTVSFSVDPDFDKPEVLSSFAKQHKVDLTNYHYLTGYSFETVQKIAKDTFKSGVVYQKGNPPEVPDLVNHPVQFYLMKDNKVYRYYDGLNPDVKALSKEIVKDVKGLTKSK